jgi:hypothetical protein
VRTARSASKLFPCAAIKAFRAGGPSANLLFAGRKVGQQEAGFLAHALCTHATEKAAAPLQHVVERLRQHSRWPTHTGLSDFAAEEAPSGERDRGAGRVVFPWCLVLQPLWHGLGAVFLDAEAKPRGQAFQRAWVVLADGALTVYPSRDCYFRNSEREATTTLALRTVTVLPAPAKYDGALVAALHGPAPPELRPCPLGALSRVSVSHSESVCMRFCMGTQGA